MHENYKILEKDMNIFDYDLTMYFDKKIKVKFNYVNEKQFYLTLDLSTHRSIELFENLNLSVKGLSTVVNGDVDNLVFCDNKIRFYGWYDDTSDNANNIILVGNNGIKLENAILTKENADGIFNNCGISNLTFNVVGENLDCLHFAIKELNIISNTIMKITCPICKTKNCVDNGKKTIKGLETKCCICLDANAEVLFDECSHVNCCMKCVVSMYNNTIS